MRKILSVMVFLSMAAGAQGPPTPPPDQHKAQTEPVAVRAELVQMTDEGAAKLGGDSLVPEDFFARPERGRVLQTLELMTVTPKDALLVFGHKSAIVYYDPRNSRFQIQYVDTGCKLDVKIEREPTGTYEVESRSEFSRTERARTYGVAPGLVSYPQVQVITSNTALQGVKPGQSYIVSRTDDDAARKWMESSGVTGGADRLVVLVTLIRL